MCHQSVGLIARHLESEGLPTVTLSSAWSITASVNPPRTAFVNYPLGHTAGRPDQPSEQAFIVSEALAMLHAVAVPGDIRPLPLEWPGSWRAAADGRGDTRSERHATPQWQLPSDEVAAGEPQ